MTKLIAAGCSNTDQGEKESKRKHGHVQRYRSRGIITWPQIVAERMGWDFVNIAVGGCDNTFIENSIYDAVQSTPNNEDIVVMSLWTCPMRANLWDAKFFHSIYTTDNLDADYVSRCFPDCHREDWEDLPVSYFTDLKHPFEIREPLRKYLISQIMSKFDVDYKKIMRHSARSINRTMNWLDDIGIKNYHEAGLPFIQQNILVKEENTEYGKTLNLNLDHWELGFMHELQESELLPCLHPNQAGQDVIAKMFIDKMKGKYVPLNTHWITANRLRAFVYD